MKVIEKNTSNQTALPFLTAEVIAKGDHMLLVKCGKNVVQATTALSFLFVPEIHDKVLLMMNGEENFIIQILQRPSVIPLQLRIHNDLAIHAVNAAIHVQAESLHLQGEALILNHDAIQSTAAAVDLTWQQTQFQAKELNATVDQVNLKSHFCDYVVDTLSVKAKNVLQWIDDLKQQMLGALHVSVQKHYQLDCESVDIYSKEDIKMDAKQIHMG